MPSLIDAISVDDAFAIENTNRSDFNASKLSRVQEIDYPGSWSASVFPRRGRSDPGIIVLQKRVAHLENVAQFRRMSQNEAGFAQRRQGITNFLRVLVSDGTPTGRIKPKNH